MSLPSSPAAPVAADAEAERAAGRRLRPPAGWLTLLLLLLALAALKLAFHPGLARNFLDGNFYFQIAQSVAAGEGLATRVSLYHQGLKSLPHPTNMAPLWPLLLAAVGGLIGLVRAAELLPEALYLVGLALLYGLCAALSAGFAGAGAGPGIAAPRWRHALEPRIGHALVLLFGLNPLYFEFTSVPYTEAISLALVFAGLLLVARFDRRPGAGAAFALFLVAVAALLTRGQLIGLGATLALVPVAAAWRSRLPWRRLVLPAALALLPLLAWTAWLMSWARPWRFRYLYAPAGYRETPELAVFVQRVPVDGLIERLREILDGLGVAFSLRDPDGYAASFGLAVLVPALALALLVRHPAEVRAALARVGAAGTLLPAATLLALAGLLAPLHDFHARFFREWLFGFRHGLPFVLAIALGAALVAERGGRLARGAALLLLATGAFQGAYGVERLFATHYQVGLAVQELAAFDWLAVDHRAGPLVTTAAQTLGPYSPVGLHWMECREPGTQTLALLRHAGARYVLAYPTERRCRFLREALPELRRVAAFGAPGRELELFELGERESPGGGAGG